MASAPHWGLLGAMVVALPLWGQATAPGAPRPAPSRVPLVMRDVTVIDVRDGARLADRTVVIAGNRIQALGPAKTVPIPRGARVVDGRGKYLIPGLWDLHVHPMQYVDVAYPLFVANGVTGVRDAGSNVPLATLTRWKEEIAAGARVGPRLLVSGQALDGPNCQSFPHHICVTTPDQARLVVDLFHAMGADMIKTYMLSDDLYFAIAAEARRIGIPFGGHVYLAGGGLTASDSGALILDHTTWFNPDVCGDALGKEQAPTLEACTTAVQQLRRNGTWLAAWRGGMIRRPDIDSLYMSCPFPPAVYEPFHPTSTADWANAYKQRKTPPDSALVRMHAAGMPYAIGTDAGTATTHSEFALSGFSVSQGLISLVVQGGFTPLEALQAATLNPVLALRMSDSLGTVEAGKLADLVLLDADPSVDIWNTTKIRAVVANGRYYDRAMLDRILRAASQEAHRIAACPVGKRRRARPTKP